MAQVRIDTESLYNDIVRLADIQDSSFISRDEVFRLMDDTWKVLHNVIVDLQNGYYLKQIDNLQPDSKNSISLPEDHYKMHSLEYKTGSNAHVPVFEKSMNEVSWLSRQEASYYVPQPIGYVMFPDRVQLYPEDYILNNGYRMTYIPQAGNISEASVEPSFVNYIKYQTAYLVSCIEEQNLLHFKDIADKWLQSIKSWGSERNFGVRVIKNLDMLTFEEG